jgi:hypothetical protein
MSRPLPKPQTMTIQEWVESKENTFQEKKKRPSRNRNRKSFKNPPRLLPIKDKLKKSIVFIDNDDANWKSDMSRFKDSIDYIPIPSSDNDHSPEESNYTKSLAKKGNLYAATIIDIMGPNAKSYPPNQGINESVAKKLKAWASSIPTEKYALFDWDRTISCVEGIVGRAVENSTEKEFLDDAFVYLMREDRIPMLKDLFRHLKAQGVHIHILTNNPGASVDSPYRHVFIEMMSRLFNEDDERAEERDFVEKGVRIHIFTSSVSKVSLISREELESMLHSTEDYTMAGQPLHKSNMVCHIVPGMRRCPPVPLIPLNKKKKTRRRRNPLLVIV